MRKNLKNEKVLVKIYDIQWDTDEKEDLKNLPVEVVHMFKYNKREGDFEDMISDWLSDEYGFCHNGFYFSII